MVSIGLGGEMILWRLLLSGGTEGQQGLMLYGRLSCHRPGTMASLRAGRPRLAAASSGALRRGFVLPFQKAIASPKARAGKPFCSRTALATA
jgi:hypothetical protein